MGRSYRYSLTKDNEMNVKVVTDEQFNNKNQFKIYQVDGEGKRAIQYDKNTGEPRDKKPMFNFGIEKAKALLANVEALKKYIEDNS